MRSHHVVTILSITAALSVVVACDEARAAEQMCVREAREMQKECRAACRDDFLTEKDLCRNIDPACGDACRTAYASCTAPFSDILTSCKDTCRTTYLVERDVCPVAGHPERDACVDEAQVRAFSCRDTCRENRDVRDGRRTCRRARKLCVRACPPPGPETPPDPGLG